MLIANGTHTFNVAHGFREPSAELRQALARTAGFFTTTLGTL